jgi:fructokinase
MSTIYGTISSAEFCGFRYKPAKDTGITMRIGIDLGGTKIEGIAIDSVGTELARHRIPTPQGDYDATLGMIVQVIKHLESEAGLTGSVGIGIPGTVSPATGLIKNANSVCLIGRALDRDLEALLGRPVRLANDANCFAMSEASDGAAAGASVVFGVILGTGVGGGLTFSGAPHTGINAVAGEWGHNPLPWPTGDEHPGADCYCGKQGCIETFLSGSGLLGTYEAQGGEAGLDSATIAERATNGEPEAMRALEVYEQQLARSLATVINIVDPDVIVLGGGLSNMDRLYDTVPALWQQWVFSDQADTLLRRNKHGDSSGVRGAAWLWPASLD